MEGIMEGRYVHSDLAMFTLHQQALHQHKKSLLKKPDFVNMRHRLEILYPMPADFNFPLLDKDHLPGHLQGALQDHRGWSTKIEWMHKGEYFVDMTPDYKKKTDYNRFRNGKLYNKIVDTIGFSRWDMAYKLWVESLYRPDQLMFYKGKAYDMETKSLVNREARMISTILYFDALITITFLNDENED